jgi:flagellar hook-associated protein 1 FlgK
MTSLSSILSAGLSSLRASQTAMSVASQNIANANTPGYVRTGVTFAPNTQLGPGAGVSVSSIQRAADRFLATASYLAEGARGASTARAEILARAQAAFGDPASDTSLFATLDDFWSALQVLGVDPSSTLRRDDVVGALQSSYAEMQSVSSSIQSMIAEADQRIGDAVDEAQSLINRITALNDEIRLNVRAGADPSAAENAQSALIDELSALIDVRVTPQAEGGVHVRTGGGALLVGVTAATLTYEPNTAQFATHGVVKFNESIGIQSNLEPFLQGGTIAGLLQVRDHDLTDLAEALGGFAASLGDALNQIHNENASSPAVSNLVGRQTGLLGTDALNFTGIALIAVTDSTGNLAQRLTVNFTTGEIVGEDPAATYAFANSIDAFTAALDTALGAATPAGAADFTDGQLSVSVPGGGLVIQQDSPDPNILGDTATPSARAGRGFAHFFGLNDLVTRPTPLFFENGIVGADEHGFTAGGDITFEVRDNLGRQIGTRTISIAGALANPGSDWDDLIGELNAAGTGLGGYGVFALNGATGRMEFTPAAGFDVQLINDSTQRGGTGVSLSSLHGLSKQSTAGRALETSVNPLVGADPTRLAVGRPNIHAAIDDRLIEAGDNRGAAQLLAARDSTRTFAAAGALSAQSTSLALYAARLGGEAGRMAADALRQQQGAVAVATAANDRRAQVEGVSLDDELMRMTTYQNSYAAAARVIQAAQDMYDILLSIGYR